MKYYNNITTILHFNTDIEKEKYITYNIHKFMKINKNTNEKKKNKCKKKK